jgi:hypothetical protein
MNRRDWKSRSVAEPEAGFFLMRLVRNGPFVPARIRHIDRMWSAVINGEAFPASSDPANAPRVFSIWHSAEQITEAEYRKRLLQSRDAPPDDPLANPDRPIDLTILPPLF